MNAKYATACLKIFEALKLIKAVKEPKLGESTNEAERLLVGAAQLLQNADSITTKK